MDLNQLLHRHQVALMRQENAATPEEQRAYVQFARDHSVQIQTKRAESGALNVVTGFPT